MPLEMKKIRELRVFLKTNRLISFVFLLTVAFYLYQHSTGFSWDFAAYVMNAKYVFGGYYFEWARPPLAALAMTMFSFAGWLAAEHIYIIGVSLLHLYSSLRLADAYGLDRKSFYVFSLTPFSIITAFSVGTELFSVALLQLFLAALKDKKSGMAYGLSVLLRYSNLIYVFLFAFQKDLKKTLVSIAVAFAVFLPWLALNLYVTGDMLTGVADYYAVNFLFRSMNYAPQGFNVFDILVAWNILIPFFILAVLEMFRREKTSQTDNIMLSFLFLTLLSYLLAVFKDPRFLYASSIPLAYFAAKIAPKKCLIFAAISFTAVLFMPYQLESPDLYKHIAAASENCAAQSNIWVALNYYGRPSEPFPYAEGLNDSVKSGYRIVLLKYVRDPSYATNETFLRSFPIIEENDAYIILGNSTLCRKPGSYNETFLNRQNSYYEKYRNPLNLTPLKALLYSLS